MVACPTGSQLKALSLTPPYGSLIAAGAKRIETRSWGTAYRGPLAIHQTQGLAGSTESRLQQLCNEPPLRAVLLAAGFADTADPTCVAADRLPRAGIVAVVYLADCIPMDSVAIPAMAAAYLAHDPTWDRAQEHAFGHYAPGRWAWVLDSVEICDPPTAARGRLGLWPITLPRGT
ncbi:MAG TPA: ASCH domain-containing protein [Chloroflexia bacterium]|nr:ASCH domain-containing protein [Chloroflexia bacterium]